MTGAQKRADRYGIFFDSDGIAVATNGYSLALTGEQSDPSRPEPDDARLDRVHAELTSARQQPTAKVPGGTLLETPQRPFFVQREIFLTKLIG